MSRLRLSGCLNSLEQNWEECVGPTPRRGRLTLSRQPGILVLTLNRKLLQLQIPLFPGFFISVVTFFFSVPEESNSLKFRFSNSPNLPSLQVRKQRPKKGPTTIQEWPLPRPSWSVLSRHSPHVRDSKCYSKSLWEVEFEINPLLWNTEVDIEGC